ncbi:hypothetical protein NL676_016531 [Syzygium grande]|nr:hypothetical protein NL676_016531 [Syzygium grande]
MDPARLLTSVADGLWHGQEGCSTVDGSNHVAGLSNEARRWVVTPWCSAISDEKELLAFAAGRWCCPKLAGTGLERQECWTRGGCKLVLTGSPKRNQKP